jgi:hypothetical protein
MVVGKGTESVKSTLPSPDAQAGFQAGQQAFDAEKAGAAATGEAAQRAAEVEQKRQEALAEEARRKEADMAAAVQAEKDRQQQALLAHEETVNNLKRDMGKTQGAFDNWGAGDTAKAIVGVLGGLLARDGSLGKSASNLLAVLEAHVDREYAKRKDDLESRYKLLAEQDGYDSKLAQSAKNDMMNLSGQYELTYDRINRQFDSQMKALGGPNAAAATQIMGAKIDQKKAEAQQKFGMAYNTTITQEAQILPRGRGGAGGGGQDVVANLVRMAETPGVKRSQIVDAANAAHLPEKAWKNQVDLAFADREKGEAKADASKATKAADEDKRAVRTPDGAIVGYLGGSRPNVASFQDRYVQYDDALKSLEALKVSKGLGIPVGDAYDRAVLAVAATTTANPSDKTTAHEAGTLKRYGLINEDAINKTIEHLQQRKQAFTNQLRPTDDAAPAAKPKAAFTPGKPKVLNGKVYIEVGPNDWQPEGGK